MACVKIGSKTDGFQRKGQAWFCASGLQSDVVIQVSEMSFHLHKFPLVTRSGKLALLIEESSEQREEGLPHIDISEIPGGADTFELVAKFCYGVKLELTARNVVPLRCAGEYLEMTEEFGEDNLIARADGFLNQLVLRQWKECIQALSTCSTVLSAAEDLGIVRSCVEAVALKACTEPSLFGWPMPNTSAQSPGGSFLWNGISTGARPKRPRSDWWYEDVASLSLPLYRRVIVAMQKRGIRPENIAGALMHFAKRYLPGLHKRQTMKEGSGMLGSLSLSSVPSEHDQKVVLEMIESLLPMRKAVVPTKFLSGLLRSAVILSASHECRSNIELRIGLQLDEANLEDLLLPNLVYNMETLYDIDCVQRILDHFLLRDVPSSGPMIPPMSLDHDDHVMGAPSLSPVRMVARLIDDYLAEVAPDVNVKPSKFQTLAESLPDISRASDDGLYRAIDIYLKAHPWLSEDERERLCRSMDCQNLSLEACAHAAQNERLPLRTIVQVLFFEQLKLRTAIASSFMITDNSQPLDDHHQSIAEGAMPSTADRSLRGDRWANAIRDNQALKIDMDQMKARVNDLEKECSGMREELGKLGKVRGFGGIIKSHICKTKGNDVQDQSLPSGDVRGHHSRNTKHHRSSTLT